MITNPFFYARASAALVLSGLVASCVSPQDEFGYAVSRGDVAGAAAYNGPNYANMRIWKSQNESAVPMQFAIAQGNRRMAGFLLDNGARHTVNGQTLPQYAAANGRSEMANYFVSRGIGGSSDISRGLAQRAEGQRVAQQNAREAKRVGDAILKGLIYGGGGNSRSSSGHIIECPLCHGSGKDDINTTSDCLRCDGRGSVDDRVIGPWSSPF